MKKLLTLLLVLCLLVSPVLAWESDNPKLWVTGGYVEADGSAMVGIVLEGQGSACSGQFTLTYPAVGCTLEQVTLSDYTAQATTSVNDALPGRLIFSWSNGETSTEPQTLLLLKFKNVTPDANSRLLLSQVSLFNAKGSKLTATSIRSGKLLNGSLAVQLPTVDTARVVKTDNNTTLSMTLDLASGTCFREAAEPLNAKPVLALYYQNQLRQVVLPQAEPTFDETGIGTLTLTATAATQVDTARIFLLEDGDLLSPLSEACSFTIRNTSGGGIGGDNETDERG